MYSTDYHANLALSQTPQTEVQAVVDRAIKKAHLGVFIVCVTNDDVLVLPEFSALDRDDIDEVIYSTDTGYSLPIKGLQK